jgi:hypothetical protein
MHRGPVLQWGPMDPGADDVAGAPDPDGSGGAPPPSGGAGGPGTPAATLSRVPVPNQILDALERAPGVKYPPRALDLLRKLVGIKHKHPGKLLWGEVGFSCQCAVANVFADAGPAIGDVQVDEL